MTRNLVALFAAVAATASLLSACGGGGGVDAIGAPAPPSPVPPPGTAQGAVVQVGNPTTMTRASIDAFAADADNGPTNPGETATCDVTIRQIQYATITAPDAALAPTAITASAGLLVPSGINCSGAAPLLTMQHGTSDSTFNASQPKGDLPLTMAKYFASHGYVVIIPDYLGYGVATGTYHPYHDAEANAVTVIDAVRATRNWFRTAAGQATGVSMSGQLFLFGTSEGGFITMATQRAMERDYPTEFTITATVPTSGSYNLSTEVLDNLLFPDDPTNSDTGSSTFILTAYQQIYADIYTTPAEVFQSPWDTTVEGLFPGSYGSNFAAFQGCQIPFNVHTAPSPEAAGCNTGTNPLLQPQYVSDYLASSPGTSGGVSRVHIEANDLLQAWQNVAPMTVCYGDLDPNATRNATAAASFFSVPIADVQVDGPSFVTSWVAQAVATGQNADTYHGQIEAPACTAYARYSVFDNYVTPL